MASDSSSELAFREGVAVVAGGSGDLGAAICLALARSGSNVAFTYRSRKTAAEVLLQKLEALGVRAFAEQVDLRDFAAVDAFVSRARSEFGRIHSAVYAAGPQLNTAFLSGISPEEFSSVVDADVKGAFHIFRAALPHMKRDRGGALLAITTTSTGRVPVKEILSPLPKAAIEMMVKGIAKEEARYGIRANSLGPGWISSSLQEHVAKQMSKEQFDGLIRGVPMRRMGRPEEIADVAVFLLSSKASYLTGQTIAVDGGLQL
ncbi:short-chain dehydrogenase/reductase SDR [Hyaloraphidium curvatum]|nr:short-chain dehydrogenase/reductase SDR [Hyaloraphidium curvatum]